MVGLSAPTGKATSHSRPKSVIRSHAPPMPPPPSTITSKPKRARTSDSLQEDEKPKVRRSKSTRVKGDKENNTKRGSKGKSKESNSSSVAQNEANGPYRRAMYSAFLNDAFDKRYNVCSLSSAVYILLTFEKWNPRATILLTMKSFHNFALSFLLPLPFPRPLPLPNPQQLPYPNYVLGSTRSRRSCQSSINRMNHSSKLSSLYPGLLRKRVSSQLTWGSLVRWSVRGRNGWKQYSTNASKVSNIVCFRSALILLFGMWRWCWYVKLPM